MTQTSVGQGRRTRLKLPAVLSVEPETPTLFDKMQILTIDDLAALLGKKPQTIRNWVARREVPFIPGRPVKFLAASIATWLQHKEIKPCQ